MAVRNLVYDGDKRLREKCAEIKNIDETINNKQKLQEEYERRNKDLPIDKKIFINREGLSLCFKRNVS